MALSSIASEQTKATKITKCKVRQFLDYLATCPDAQVKYNASDMILNIHSDASYLSEFNAHSCFAGYYFLASTPKPHNHITINGNIFILCGIAKFVVASAAEVKLGARFMNAKEGKIIHLILNEMGHNHCHPFIVTTNGYWHYQ